MNYNFCSQFVGKNFDVRICKLPTTVNNRYRPKFGVQIGTGINQTKFVLFHSREQQGSPHCYNRISINIYGSTFSLLVSRIANTSTSVILIDLNRFNR